MPHSVAPSASASILDWARYYVARGWSAVPARLGTKFPAGEWLRYQTTLPSEAQLTDWFGQQGFSRLGIVTGKHSGVIVADFDGQTGMDTLAALDARGFPQSIRQFTPTGGCHVLLQHPGVYVPTRKSAESPWRDVLPGMDIRGDGGFIMAAPSVGAEFGTYDWDVDAHPEHNAVEAAPQAFLDLICQASTGGGIGKDAPVTRAPGPLGLDLGTITDGRETYMRNTVMAVTRGLFDRLQRMPTEAEVFEEGWPQYSARVDLSRPGRGENEFRAKVRYTLARIARGAVPSFSAPAAASEPTGGQAPGGGAGEATHKRGIQLLTLAEVEALPPPVFLIDGLIPDQAIVIPYGPPKAGKTFVVLSMALHIASGRPWMGRKVIGGGVVYVAGEGVGGLSLRIRAMRQAYDIPADIPFWIVPRAVNFRDPKAVEALKEAIKATIGQEPISLVVLDTFARAMPGVDENSAEEVGAVIAGCDDIKFEFQATVMPIHHMGKDTERGLRGSSAIHGALDASLQITQSEGRVTIKNDNQKDAEPADPFQLEMRKVELGLGKSSLVPFLLDGPVPEEARAKGRPRKNNDTQLAINALAAALAREGTTPPASLDLSAAVRVVQEAAWQRELMARWPKGETDKDREKVRLEVRYARRQAVRDGAAVIMEGYAWLAK